MSLFFPSLAPGGLTSPLLCKLVLELLLKLLLLLLLLLLFILLLLLLLLLISLHRFSIKSSNIRPALWTGVFALVEKNEWWMDGKYGE